MQTEKNIGERLPSGYALVIQLPSGFRIKLKGLKEDDFFFCFIFFYKKIELLMLFMFLCFYNEQGKCLYFSKGTKLLKFYLS